MPTIKAPVVLVTGELTGVGRAAALAFAKKGAKVVVAGRRDEASGALVRELLSYGSEVEFIAVDAHKEDDIHALIDNTVARFDRLDVAPNNSVAEGSARPTENEAAPAGQAPHQVVEASVRATDGMTAIASLIYLQAPGPPALFSTLQFSFTPLQSLRLARDLVAAAEKFAVPPPATVGANSAFGGR